MERVLDPHNGTSPGLKCVKQRVIFPTVFTTGVLRVNGHQLISLLPEEYHPQGNI